MDKQEIKSESDVWNLKDFTSEHLQMELEVPNFTQDQICAILFGNGKESFWFRYLTASSIKNLEMEEWNIPLNEVLKEGKIAQRKAKFYSIPRIQLPLIPKQIEALEIQTLVKQDNIV